MYITCLPSLAIFFIWRNTPQWFRASSITRFLDHNRWCTTVGRTPLDEWSARRRDLYLTTYNTHNRHTSVSPVGFEPTISVGQRSQTYYLDRAANGTGVFPSRPYIFRQLSTVMQPPPLGCVATERFPVHVQFGLRVQDHASFVTGDLILSWSSCYRRDKMHTASFVLYQMYVLHLHSCRKKLPSTLGSFYLSKY